MLLTIPFTFPEEGWQLVGIFKTLDSTIVHIHSWESKTYCDLGYLNLLKFFIQTILWNHDIRFGFNPLMTGGNKKDKNKDKKINQWNFYKSS